MTGWGFLNELIKYYGQSVDYISDECTRSPPLHVALSFKKKRRELKLGDIVRWLIDHGADVDRMDDRYGTPLFIADEEMKVLLRERGATNEQPGSLSL